MAQRRVEQGRASTRSAGDGLGGPDASVRTTVGVISSVVPTGPFAPCSERGIERDVPALLRRAGWRASVRRRADRQSEGERVFAVALGGDSGEVAIGCNGKGPSYCLYSETDYTIFAHTAWVEQRAAPTSLMLALLEVLAPHIGSLHCFGTDQVDIEHAWRQRSGDVAVKLNFQPEACRNGVFRLAGRETTRFHAAHAAVARGSRIEWVDAKEPERVIASAVVQDDAYEIDPIWPRCTELRVHRAPAASR